MEGRTGQLRASKAEIQCRFGQLKCYFSFEVIPSLYGRVYSSLPCALQETAREPERERETGETAVAFKSES